MERLKTASNQVVGRAALVAGRGEQATKQSLVLPMIEALGYDIWDPSEVCPEFDADFAIKKLGQKEKVDFALLADGKPLIYIEVKPSDMALDDHEGQLARYFNSTLSVVLGILTNGLEWRFFTDTAETNVMDKKPFYVARLDAAEQGLDVFQRFEKRRVAEYREQTTDYATELVYTAKIAAFLRNHIDLKDRDPEEVLIRWVLKEEGSYSGIVNLNVVNRFRSIVKTALSRTIRDIVRRSISAMDEEAAPATATVATPSPPPDQPPPVSAGGGEAVESKIVTTAEELDFYAGVKAIFERSEVRNMGIFDPGRRREVPVELGYKDTTGYFGIYFNKPGWWFIRAMLDGKNKWIGFDIPPEQGAPLAPPGVQPLPKSSVAPFRMPFSGMGDLAALEPLVVAAMRHNIQQRLLDRDLPQSPEGGKSE